MNNSIVKFGFTKLCIILLLLFTSFNCKPQKEVVDGKKVSIGIINPGVGSLRGFADLVENQVLNFRDLQFVAISYEKAERNYTRVKDYIEQRNDQLFRFHLVEGDLASDNLFMNNDLSDDFLKIFRDTDGLFFLGGTDFPPTIYKDKTSLLTNIVTPHRHYFELSFLFHLLGGSQDTSFTPLLSQNDSYVVIGFCLGMQSINVATGGSMYQDIPFDIYGARYVEDVLELDPDQQHQNYWQNLKPDDEMIWANFHRIKQINTHHIFDELWEENKTPYVYSSHHQAVKETGLNINIIATSMDNKVPEIINHELYDNVFGVQFHPEVSSLYDEHGRRLKWTPEDTLGKSYYSFLHENNSYRFHQKFWKNIGDTFSE
jgi:putative glutamine amidotransferase